MTVSQTRKNSTPIKVYCLPDEKAQIQENAEASGLSVASFIRKVAMGYQVESIVDIEQVVELSRVNADLGRLGGLLKLWLAKEGANKRGNSSRLTQSFHFFMFEPIFSPVNALNQPI